eukprot:scaffold283_cov81-Skeletonema_marinoi.AAC.2
MALELALARFVTVDWRPSVLSLCLSFDRQFSRHTGHSHGHGHAIAIRQTQATIVEVEVE